MKRLLVGFAVLVLGASLARAQAVQVDPSLVVVPEDVRRLRATSTASAPTR